MNINNQLQQTDFVQGITSDSKFHYVWIPNNPNSLVALIRSKQISFIKNVFEILIVLSNEEYSANYELFRSVQSQFPKCVQLCNISFDSIKEFNEKIEKQFIQLFDISIKTKIILICSNTFVRSLFHQIKMLELGQIVEIWYIPENETKNMPPIMKMFKRQKWFNIIKADQMRDKLILTKKKDQQLNIYNDYAFYSFFLTLKIDFCINRFAILTSIDFLKKTNSKAILQLFCQLQLDYSSKLDIDLQNILKFKQQCQNDHQKVLENIIPNYVQESFMHKIMNKMLMSHFKLYEIYYIQPLYVALFSKIKQIYKRQQSGAERLKRYPQKNLTNFTCYRGAMLNISEKNVFPSYSGQIISHLNFLSTSYDIQIAANFMVNTLIVINVSSAKKRSEEVDYGFAFIEDYTNSQMVVEKEVLFNSMSTYRVVEVIKQKDLLLSSKRQHTEKIKQILQRNNIDKIVIFLEYGAAAEIYHQIQNQEQIDEIREPMNIEKKIFEYMQQKKNNNLQIIEKTKLNHLYGTIIQSKYDLNLIYHKNSKQNPQTIPLLKMQIMEKLLSKQIKYDQFLQIIAENELKMKKIQNLSNSNFFSKTKHITSYFNDLTLPCLNIFICMINNQQAFNEKTLKNIRNHNNIINQILEKVYKKLKICSFKNTFCIHRMHQLALSYYKLNQYESFQKIQKEYFNFNYFLNKKTLNISTRLIFTLQFVSFSYRQVRMESEELQYLYLAHLCYQLLQGFFTGTQNFQQFIGSRYKNLKKSLDFKDSFALDKKDNNTAPPSHQPLYLYMTSLDHVKNNEIILAKSYYKNLISQINQRTLNKQNFLKYQQSIELFINYIFKYFNFLFEDHQLYFNAEYSLVEFINSIIPMFNKQYSINYLYILKTIKAKVLYLYGPEYYQHVKDIFQQYLKLWEKIYGSQFETKVPYQVFSYLGLVSPFKLSIQYFKKAQKRFKSGTFQKGYIKYISLILQPFIQSYNKQAMFSYSLPYCKQLIYQIQKLPQQQKNIFQNKYSLLLGYTFRMLKLNEQAETYLQKAVSFLKFTIQNLIFQTKNRMILPIHKHSKFIYDENNDNQFYKYDFALSNLLANQIALNKRNESLITLKRILEFCQNQNYSISSNLKKFVKICIPFFHIYELINTIQIAKQTILQSGNFDEELFLWVYDMIPKQLIINHQFIGIQQNVFFLNFNFQ